MLSFNSFTARYLAELTSCFSDLVLEDIHQVALLLLETWRADKRVFICGNGGSAANALHIANDFIYGVGNHPENHHSKGLDIEALSGNTAVLTCLANDTGYTNVYSHQLEVKGAEGDVLIVLSASGNSQNIIESLRAAEMIGMSTVAIVAFDGGQCLKYAHKSIHIKSFDMQIAEDAQLIIGHLWMKWLRTIVTDSDLHA